MIMSLGENVITYSVANIVAMATELYRVLFREMVKSEDGCKAVAVQVLLDLHIL